MRCYVDKKYYKESIDLLLREYKKIEHHYPKKILIDRKGFEDLKIQNNTDFFLHWKAEYRNIPIEVRPNVIEGTIELLE